MPGPFRIILFNVTFTLYKVSCKPLLLQSIEIEVVTSTAVIPLAYISLRLPIVKQ